MKKLVYFVVMLLISTALLHSQELDSDENPVIETEEREYKPFPKDSAIWVVQEYSYQSGKPGRPSHQFMYGLVGDTIINEKKYSKLYLLNDSTLNIDHNDFYVGGFREENQKVWFLVHDSRGIGNPYGLPYTDEYILYDFSKEKGDRFTRNNVLYYKCNDYGLSVYDYVGMIEEGYGVIDTEVLNVEYTLYGKELHVRHYESNAINHNVIWIEGIGSNTGLFWEIYSFPICYIPYFKLACFKQGDEVIYNDNEFGDCFCDGKPPKGQSVSDIEIPSITILPNKNNSTINIISGKVPLSFEILNLQGQTALQENILYHPQSISYQGLSKGIYIYKISDNKQVIQTGKLVLE
ncbi:hypothetical protein M2138_000249 [Dysgonomonadaceae bacterium PH5-43]|nr:hypothetical protein [Dysgonomonadaceae bacterium PH5-43]